MDVRNILVNLDVDVPCSDVLKLAASTAERFGATVSATAAARPAPELVGVEGQAATLGLYNTERQRIEERLQGLETDFLAEVPKRLRGRWVGMLDAPTDLTVQLARGADLVILQSNRRHPDINHRIDIGNIILRVGRPVLIAAAGQTAVTAKRVVVGWKDGREARRAIADALPFLKLAEDVVVVAVQPRDLTERAGLDDVVNWLHSHGVNARRDIRHPTGTDGETLLAAADQADADLLVCGAYGHSRLRESFFGGVTSDLLAAQTITRLMSN